MDQLDAICKQDIKSIIGTKPRDFDSTEAIDSFLEALFAIVEENIGTYNEKCRDNIHLSTGTRTQQCENFLGYLATLQQRNNVLLDSHEFFGTYIDKLYDLEQYKVSADAEIAQLKGEQEQLTMQKFDLERKGNEIVLFLEESRKKEKELNHKLRQLNKMYEGKKEECLSLGFRVKHMEEMANMMEPPAYHQSLVSEANGESDPAASDNIDTAVQKVQTLKSLNKKLEIELNLVKQILHKHSEQQEEKFDGNIDHFVKIQDLFNKAQIENKGLRSSNGKLESQVESKQRLIAHLEDKVTQVMLEKEDIIVKLKSEIIILKSQNEQSKSRLDQQINSNKEAIEKQLQAQYTDQIVGLSNQLEQGKKEKEEQSKRIEELIQQYADIESEFTQFRETKEEQEKERGTYLQEVEEKLQAINGHYEGILVKLQEKMDELDNQNQVFQKSNHILEMKLGYLKESTHTLLKQKQFIKEDIEKSQLKLQASFSTLTKTMFEANSNKDYLISVKKAAKQTQSMVDMGLQSLNNVLQILNFFKIEELLNMLSSEFTNANYEILINQMESDKGDTIEINQRFLSKRSSEKTHIDPVQGLRVQDYLNSNKRGQVSDQLDNSLNEQYQIDRNEEYYFHHCSLEMSSILLKMIADVMLLLGACSEFDSLPSKFSSLLDLANEKTDAYIEQEIYARYLVEAKKLIESKVAEGGDLQNQQAQQIQELKQVMQTHGRNHLQIQQQSEDDQISVSGGDEDNTNLSPHKASVQRKSVAHSSQPRISMSNGKKSSPPTSMEMLNLQVSDQAQLDQRRKEQRHKSVFVNANQPSPKKAHKSSKSPHKQKASANHGGTSHNKETAAQLEQLKVELQEYKLQSKQLQLQLATKIVLLEEQLDNAEAQREKDILEMEEVRKQEIERTRIGIQQRENHLLSNASEQKERIESLEKQITELRTSLDKQVYELEIVQVERNEFNHKINLKEQELSNFRENVGAYLNIKTSNRNTFGIAFEINQHNQSMINEAMVKYYLNKCLNIDKSKFRFITSDSEDYDEVTLAKIIIEIVDDEKSKIQYANNNSMIDVQSYFQLMKQQIRDGSSILYDLGALYFSINLGYFGIKGSNSLKEYHIINRKGHYLGRDEFIVTILRHKTNPLKLKVIAVNYSSGEEYHLDLEQEDIIELLEGNSLRLLNTLGLEEPSPELLDSILANLKLLIKDEITILVCEHKVYFNNLFHPLISSPSKTSSSYQSKYETVLKTLDIKDEQNLFRNSAYRNKKITDKVEQENIHHYSKSLLVDQPSQTDFEVALMYDSFKQMYMGNQRVGKKLEFKVSIIESHKSNSMQVIIEEIKTKKRMQVCFMENKKVDEKLPCDFIIYTHCMEIKGSHMVLFSLEKVLGEGLFIKIHDLKELQTEEFFLLKKSTGHYSKLNRAQGGQFIIKEDFRNLIYDLTFSYTASIPSSQVLLANIAYHKEVHSLKQSDQTNTTPYDINQQLLVFPHRQRNGLVSSQKTPSGVQHLKLLAKLTHQGKQESALVAPTTDKGLLLYRNTFIVRCSFEGAQESEQNSLISFYQKREEISVEVFLYKDAQKMSIASQVNACDLFGADYQGLSFSQKVDMLDQMMEKLYVLSENQSYHLKVENEAIPISEVIEDKKKGQTQNTNILAHGYEQSILMDKIKEIRANREDVLHADKTAKFQAYVMIQNHFYEYRVYFMTKIEKESQESKISPKKNKSLTRRVTLDRQISNVDEYIEDNIDFDQIYIELTDKDQELYSTLLNQKALGELLMKNKENISFRQAFAKNKQSLTDFLIQLITIDRDSGLIVIDNSKVEKQEFLLQYKENVQGLYVKKGSHEGDEQTESINAFQKELITKRLMMNQEVEMCEFIYDIKLFENILKADNQVLSYSMEVFSLNDPEIFYNFNYPIQSSTLESPFYMGIDVINLIEHPFKDDENKLIDTVSIESSLKKNFQNLFSKYIDNNLMILVQGQSFPFSINFSIVEPNSKLQWSYQILVQECSSYLSSSLGKLTVVDQAIIDQFVVLVLNEKKSKEKSFKLNVLEEQVVSDDLASKIVDIQYDIDLQQYLFSHDVFTDFRVTLFKQDSTFILNFKHGVLDKSNIERNKDSSLEQFQYRVDMKGQSEKMYSKMFSFKHTNQQYQKVLVAILDIKQDKLTLKIIDLSTENNQNQILYQFIITCNQSNSIHPNKIQHEIIETKAQQEESSSKVNGTSEHKQNKNHMVIEQIASLSEISSFDNMEPGGHSNLMIPLKHNSTYQMSTKLLQRNHKALCEAFILGLKSFYSNSLVDLICQTQNEIASEDGIQKRDDQTSKNYGDSNEFKEFFSAKVKRLQLMIKPQKKEMVLHRKTYFDEGSEKLIIVLVTIETSGSLKSVDPVQASEDSKARVHPSRKSLELDNEVTKFKIVICEPENNKNNEFVLSLEQCFLEEEILSINKKNIIQLKKIAKILVEERTIIKRVNNEDGAENGNTYAIEISINQMTQQLVSNPDEYQSPSSQAQEDVNKRSKLGPLNQIITGSGIIGGNQMNIKTERQRLAEEIMELDEEDEEDSIKKVGDGNSRGVRQQSIIEEESQEEDHSPEDFRTTSRRQINNQDKSEILITENITSQHDHNYNEDIDGEELRKFQDQELTEGNQEDEESIGNYALEESQLNVVFVKQLPGDQILEIIEAQIEGGKFSEESGELRFVIRKKNGVDQTIIGDKVLNEKEIREVTGFVGDIHDEGAKEEMFEILADIVLEQL